MMYLDELNKIPYFFDIWQKQLEKRPDEILFVDVAHNINFTIKESDEISGKVYAFLKSKGIGKEDFVLINLPRGATTFLSMIGVWKAGAAFVVTENTLAPERIEFIRKDCSCKLTIDNDVWEEILDMETETGYVKSDDHDAAFAVYTSGSTGNPKGVLHEYGGLKHMVYAVHWTPQDLDKPVLNCGMIAPLNFIANVVGMVVQIYKLDRMIILPYSLVKNPVKLLEFYKENQIKTGYFPPSYIRALGDKIKDSMETVLTASEPANGIYIDGVTIINNYGMSEVPGFVSSFVIDKKYDICPIGRIESGIPYLFIDEKGNNIEDDSIGEICVETPFTRGYINLPEQTSKTFVNGFYHTGDLAHRLPDGNFVICGRANDMIKINGNRIEPAEIEATFKRITKVDWCAAKGIQEKRRSYVCLYYKDNIDLNEEIINKKMQEYLPSYMIPAYYMKIDKIPMLSNGKMNRKALPDPIINDFKEEYIAPRDEIEKKLCESFAKALNIKADTVSIKDDFYKLGGDSISTMQVVVNADSLDLNAKDIFKFKSVEQLASFVRERQKIQTESLDNQLEKELLIPHKLNQMQIKLFDYQLYKVKGTMWNLSVCHLYDKSVNTNKLKKAVEQVIKAHPALSYNITFNKNNELVFVYKPENNFNIDIINTTEKEFNEIKKELIKPFKMLKSPLFRSSIFETEKNIYLFIDLHHVIGDGNTISIILRDIEKAYFDEPIEKDYYPLELANIEKNQNNIQQNKEYFNKKYSGINWYSIPEPDFVTRDITRGYFTKNLSVNINEIENVEKKYNISRNTIAIVAGLIALNKYSGKNEILTNWIYDNRTTKNSANYVGLMIKTLPVGVYFDKISSFSELIDEVKKQVNDGIQNSDYDYFVEYESALNTDCMEVNFVGNVNFSAFGQRLKYKPVYLEKKDTNATARLEIDLWVENNSEISVKATYRAKIYKEENINRFLNMYIEAFKQIVKGEI